MKNGEFVWFEMATVDPDLAGDFYNKVLGWSIFDLQIPGMAYRVGKVNDIQVAGLMAYLDDLPEDARTPSWIGYIMVDDVDDRTEAVKKAGGRVFRVPEDMANVGRFSVVADSQGAAFMLFKPSQLPERPAAGTEGTIAWTELHTKDSAAALAFYGALLGWSKAGEIPWGDDKYLLFAPGGDAQATGGIASDAGSMAPSWTFYFTVADIDMAVDAIHRGGGRIHSGPELVKGNTYVVRAVDNQGGCFGIMGAQSQTK